MNTCILYAIPVRALDERPPAEAVRARQDWLRLRAWWREAQWEAHSFRTALEDLFPRAEPIGEPLEIWRTADGQEIEIWHAADDIVDIQVRVDVSGDFGTFVRTLEDPAQRAALAFLTEDGTVVQPDESDLLQAVVRSAAVQRLRFPRPGPTSEDE